MFARLLTLAAFVALSGLTAPATRAAERVSVVAPIPVIFSLPFWIADRKGFLADEGIEAKLDYVSDGREITRRLLTGAAQFSISGPDAVLIDGHSGGPLRIVAGTVPRPPLFLIVKPSIKSFAGLRGANIGALSLTEGSSKLLIRMAKAEGLSADDLKITAVGGAPARWTLLKEGKIDAGMQPLPLNYEAEEAGFNDLGWAGKYEPDWQFNTINANREWARKNPQVTTGFVRAMLRAQRLIFAQPDEAAAIAAAELKSPVPMMRKSLVEAARLGILDPNLDWSEIGLKKIYENMQADGVMPPERTFDIGKVVDGDYLRKAQSSVAGGIK